MDLWEGEKMVLSEFESELFVVVFKGFRGDSG